MNSNCSNLLDMRNPQEQVQKAVCYHKLFWPFTVFCDLKNFANSRPSASNFKSFSWSLEQFFSHNFGNKIPFRVLYLESTQLDTGIIIRYAFLFAQFFALESDSLTARSLEYEYCRFKLNVRKYVLLRMAPKKIGILRHLFI